MDIRVSGNIQAVANLMEQGGIGDISEDEVIQDNVDIRLHALSRTHAAHSWSRMTGTAPGALV